MSTGCPTASSYCRVVTSPSQHVHAAQHASLTASNHTINCSRCLRVSISGDCYQLNRDVWAGGSGLLSLQPAVLALRTRSSLFKLQTPAHAYFRKAHLSDLMLRQLSTLDGHCFHCRSDGTGGESIYGEKFAVSIPSMYDCSNS